MTNTRNPRLDNLERFRLLRSIVATRTEFLEGTTGVLGATHNEPAR